MVVLNKQFHSCWPQSVPHLPDSSVTASLPINVKWPIHLSQWQSYFTKGHIRNSTQIFHILWHIWMKFGTENTYNNKSWVLWKLVQCKPFFTYGHKWNFNCILYIIHLIWLKFHTRVVHNNLKIVCFVNIGTVEATILLGCKWISVCI